ncbi:hypothetical protein KYC5002_02930 [Archangium violaceum]|uniref:hypothetical protein n=1 Tax=Archangium violaceum TaxID=83451 RepID=UPI002B299589|nr:hypothetical protein KYC5002_02930 [Archangium gephyra]
MQRSRSTFHAPDTTGEVLGEIPAPVSQAELPSPRALLEEVRSPGAARAEVDALLNGLARPLGPGESARERADLLHEILGDEQVRDYLGSGGRKVAHVAVLQWVELGFPYALEVPPEQYAQARAAAGHREVTQWKGMHRGMGLVATTFVGALEALPVLFLVLGGKPTEVALALVWILGVALTSFVPAAVAETAPVVSRDWLRTLLKLAVMLPALPWLAAAALMGVGSLVSGAYWWVLVALLPLVVGLLRLSGAKWLYGSSADKERPEPR